MEIKSVERMLMYGPEIIETDELDGFLNACAAYASAYEDPVAPEIQAARDQKGKTFRLVVSVRRTNG